jgi:hypothetical protein
MREPVTIVLHEHQDIQALLEEFAVDIGYRPAEATVVTDIYELPICLQLRARQCRLTSWRSWRNDTCVWFIEAMPFSIFEFQTALEVLFYSQDGVAVAAGVWSRNDGGHWELRYILEPEDFLEDRHARAALSHRENVQRNESAHGVSAGTVDWS